MNQHIESNQLYYDRRFGSQPQILNEEEKRRWFEIEKQLLTSEFSHGLQIADFGCGRGWLSDRLSKYGKVTGFDLSEKAVNNAAASFAHCTFHQLNAEGNIPAEFKMQFDLVVSSEVIEHTEAQKQYLLNAKGLLKKGGKLLLTTPNGQWKNDFYKSGREKWQQPVENWRKPEELQDLLEEAGFTVTSASSFYSEWLFDFRPGIGAYKIVTYPPARKMIKLLGLYDSIVSNLNKKYFGLNLMISAIAK